LPAPVTGHRERFTLPIVPLLPPDPNPALPSTGERAIYPYTRAYRFGAEPVERELEALVLKNDLLDLQIVPALGGRLWGATNRQTNQPLFYTPKRVGMINFGLRGGWYSGGVEFNFPRGHTVIANETLPAVLRRYPNGASAAIVGGVDLTRRVGWSIGIRLEPGCSSIHFDIFLYNRTSLPANYSWWLNASIPPSPELEYTNGTTEVRAHFLGRREHLGEPFSWPLHENKDYRWYIQCAEPTSLFQLAGDERWFGYYLHDRDEGMVRVGSAADAPGLKFWNSGQIEEGYLWGKYQTCGERYSNSELQSGRPETQMDYGLLPAHGTLRWTESWRPVWGLGGLTAASEAVALHLLPDGKGSNLRLLGDRLHPDCTVLVSARGDEYRYPCSLVPEHPVTLTLPVQADSNPMEIEVFEANGERIFSYQRPDDQMRRSALVDALQLRSEKEKTPDELTAEELALEAEHLDRLMQPLAAVDLANQALGRDQGLIAAHLYLARRGLLAANYDDTRRHCLAILWRDPAHEAAHYQLALSDLWRGNARQAEIEFEHMLGHSYLLSAAAWFELGQLRLASKDWAKGLQALAHCLEREANYVKAQALRAAIHRRLGHLPEAQQALAPALELAPIDPLVRTEAWRLAPEPKPAAPWRWTPSQGENQFVDLRSAADTLQDALETACDYLACGFLDDAASILEVTLGSISAPDPVALYCLGYVKEQLGDVEAAGALWKKASEHSGKYVYSFRREEEAPLRAALAYQPRDGLAHALLGMLDLYRLNPEKAATELEQALRLRPDWDQPIRLLAICRRMQGDALAAAKLLEQAVAVNPENPGLYVELDELLATLAHGDSRRKIIWANAPASILDEDHARGRYAAFLIDREEYGRAVELLLEHTFFPEEGSSVYRELFVSANLGLAIREAEAGQFERALELSQKAATYPDCLGLSTPFIRYDAAAYVLQAAILRWRGEEAAARSMLERAAGERHRETNAAEYFSGVAYRYLGQEHRARAKFEHLIEKSKLDAAWPGRDPDYSHLLAVLGRAGLGNQNPSQESLPPGLRKNVAMYSRLLNLLLSVQGGKGA
jgi:hypothetical protein